MYTKRPTFSFPGPFNAPGTVLSEKVMLWSRSPRTCRMLLFLLDQMKVGKTAVTRPYCLPQKLNRTGKGYCRRHAVPPFLSRKDANLL